MKKFAASALATVGILGASLTLPAAPAAAQIAVSATCVARSEYATGQWISTISPDNACANAMYQCRIRTPTYGTCYIVRWWYNY